jgi:predicted amidohydrolase
MKTILLLLSCAAVSLRANEFPPAARQALLAQSPPRKVVVATVCHWFDAKADADERAAAIDRLFAEAVAETGRRFPGAGLDLFVLPEHALQRRGSVAADRALRLDEEPVRRIVAAVARHKTWLILPMILREDAGGRQVFSNAAVLFDRTGTVVGIYRKTHPITTEDGTFENGITPGRDYPVFATDFGRVGMQICWDMSYDEGWAALAAGGAELVVLPSASPQNVRPASHAQRFGYWVVSSTPRDNAAVFNPLGLIDAQVTKPGVLVHRFDLVSVAVHWSPRIEEGRAFQRRFGNRGGYVWSAREDTGLFWSNEHSTPVGTMLQELGVEPMASQIERIGTALRSVSP